MVLLSHREQLEQWADRHGHAAPQWPLTRAGLRNGEELVCENARFLRPTEREDWGDLRQLKVRLVSVGSRKCPDASICGHQFLRMVSPAPGAGAHVARAHMPRAFPRSESQPMEHRIRDLVKLVLPQGSQFSKQLDVRHGHDVLSVECPALEEICCDIHLEIRAAKSSCGSRL